MKMDPNFGGKTGVCSPVMTEMKAVGKSNLEWDLNDWKWDGDHLLASPLNPSPSDCSSRHPFPFGPEPEPEPMAKNNGCDGSYYVSEVMNGTNDDVKEMEKRKRVGGFRDQGLDNEPGPLNLRLGEQVYFIGEDEGDKVEGNSVKKSKPNGSARPVCQVEGCRADLSAGKDYHRRHRVCEVHSKVSEALVGNKMQRFCQQCSKFHLLEAFDEGKRSCRNRLAGHNKRRRKVHEVAPNASSMTDEKSAACLVVGLLNLLSNMHNNTSDKSKDQDVISHLLSKFAGQVDGSNMPELEEASQSLFKAGSTVGNPEKNMSRVQESSQAAPSAVALKGLLMRGKQHEIQQTLTSFQDVVQHPADVSLSAKGCVQTANCDRHRHNGIDLNIDSHECMDNADESCTPEPKQGLQKSSPPQTSGSSDSTSSLSSPTGSETRGCTDRIVFKLFGKNPNDLPHLLRPQLVNWLSRTPTDIEGYIRPGCIVLTIYLRLNNASWEELCYDISSSLSRLLSVSDYSFWKTGWIYTRIQQYAAFICDGRIVLDTPLPYKIHQSYISSISPIAVPAAQTVQLMVKGSNLCGATFRLLCGIEGEYLVEESCSALVENSDIAAEQNGIQSLSFCCSIPDVVGRGFIEVEDQGLSGCFFPFIVADPDICSEICMLEKQMEIDGTDEGIGEECSAINAKNDALYFIHEIGWLLNRNRWSKPDQSSLPLDCFSFDRLKWLIEFSMDRNWCAVLKKLLDFFFIGIIDTGEHASVELALSEMTLLHTAVQRNSRSLVDFLLRYKPLIVQEDKSGLEKKQSDHGLLSSFLFRPDVPGSHGLTPLHIAASCAGFENVLDALLEDPGMVGIEAWEKVQDSSGLTPKDYAILRGYNNYITLFHNKINKNSSSKHVVVDILALSKLEFKQKQLAQYTNIFYTEKLLAHQSCNLCGRKAGYGYRGVVPTCRPAMLSLITIAVVCVCTALLFKSMPRLCYAFGPFRWESLKYGAT